MKDADYTEYTDERGKIRNFRTPDIPLEILGI
jgi:hypothetical protein